MAGLLRQHESRFQGHKNIRIVSPSQTLMWHVNVTTIIETLHDFFKTFISQNISSHRKHMKHRIFMTLETLLYSMISKYVNLNSFFCFEYKFFHFYEFCHFRTNLGAAVSYVTLISKWFWCQRIALLICSLLKFLTVVGNACSNVFSGVHIYWLFLGHCTKDSVSYFWFMYKTGDTGGQLGQIKRQRMTMLRKTCRLSQSTDHNTWLACQIRTDSRGQDNVASYQLIIGVGALISHCPNGSVVFLSKTRNTDSNSLVCIRKLHSIVQQ